jgi:hypothetical protein
MTAKREKIEEHLSIAYEVVKTASPEDALA